MARNFPFETPNTYTPSAANTFQFSYKYSNNMNNLMTNNLLTVGNYPTNLFWGGVSYEDVPQLYYGAIKYDYDTATLTIDNLFNDSFEGVEFTPRQLSYTWIADTQNSDHESIARQALNWGINFGEDFNNTSYLDPNKAGNFPNNRAPYTYFADNIPVNKLGVSIGVKYINIDDWNDSNNTTAGNGLIQRTSLANFIGMRDNDPDYSKYRLVGFYVLGRQIMKADGTIKAMPTTNSPFYYGAPANMLMSNYIRSIFSYLETHVSPFYKIPIAASSGDRTKFTSGTYIYAESSSQQGFLVNDHTGILLNEYNGDQTFDITDILNVNTKNTVKRLPYSNGDKYLIFGETTDEFYWSSVGFQLRVAPVYNTLDDLLKVIAGYGLFFTAALLDYTSINNDNIYAPVLDSDNVYHGQYTNGQKNLLNNYFEKGKNNESTYEPKDPEKEEGEGDGEGKAPDQDYRGEMISPWDYRLTPSHSQFVHYAIMSESAVEELATMLWAKPQGFWNTVLTSMYSNPLDYFISLRYYPLQLNGTEIVDDEIYLGRGGLLKFSNQIYNPNMCQFFEFGYVDIKRQYNNFLDYAPYTSISVFLPYAGTFELNPTIIMGKRLGLFLHIDMTDGSGIWQLYNVTDGQMVLMKQCKIGADIPISSLNASQMASNIVNAVMQTAQHAIGTASDYIGSRGQAAVSAITGGATEGGSSLGGIGGNLGHIAMQGPNAVLTGLSDAYNIAKASKEIPQYTGGMSGLVASVANHTPYITYNRPVCENPQNYNHVVGRLVNKAYTISTLTGYTVCRNVDVSGISSATANERAQIKQIMESGFYA